MRHWAFEMSPKAAGITAGSSVGIGTWGGSVSDAIQVPLYAVRPSIWREYSQVISSSGASFGLSRTSRTSTSVAWSVVSTRLAPVWFTAGSIAHPARNDAASAIPAESGRVIGRGAVIGDRM